jgi:membrane fusion protein (multidrug efflux system)
MALDEDKNGSKGNEVDGRIDEPVDDVPLYTKKRIMVPLIAFFALVVVAMVYWYCTIAGTVYTDDAYVDGDRVVISSKYAGRISELLVDEGDAVKQKQVLVKLDDSDLNAQEKLAKASLELAKVNLAKNEDDYRRATAQFNQNVITKEQFDHAKRSLEASQAEVASASAQLGVIQTQLKNIIITSPIDGVVAKKWAMSGDVVQVAQPVFTVYDLDHLWITANLEETKYEHVKLNDTVYVYLDTYKDTKFTGKVIELGANTASEFSLIPPNNASGNFTKVTQRIPIKISVDLNAIKNRPGSMKLLPGMSAEVRLRLK